MPKNNIDAALLSAYEATSCEHPLLDSESHFDEPFTRRSRIARAALRVEATGVGYTVTGMVHRLDSLVPREASDASAAPAGETVVKVRLPSGNLAIYAVEARHLASTNPNRWADALGQGRQLAVQFYAGTEGEGWFLRGGKHEIVEPRLINHYDRMPVLEG